MPEKEYQSPFAMIFNVIADRALTAAGRNGILVLYAHMRYADYGTGRNSWPSVGSIHKLTTLSERAIQKARKQLETEGILINRGIHPQLRTVMYDVAMPPAFSADTPRNSNGDPPSPVRPPPVTSADNREPMTKSPVPREDTLARGARAFVLFWDLYGKKKGKAKTKKLFIRQYQAGIYPTNMLDRVGAYVTATPDPQYRKDPLTWLNGEHWEDELEHKEVKESYKPPTNPRMIGI